MHWHTHTHTLHDIHYITLRYIALGYIILHYYIYIYILGIVNCWGESRELRWQPPLKNVFQTVYEGWNHQPPKVALHPCLIHQLREDQMESLKESWECPWRDIFLSCDHRPKTSPWSMTELRNGTCMVFVCTCYVPTEKLRFWSHVSTGSWARLWYKFQIWTFEIGRSLKKCNRGAVADDRAISSIAPYIILFKWSIDVNLYTLVFFSFSLTLMCFINSVCQYNSI